jgi:hypothetical protein
LEYTLQVQTEGSGKCYTLQAQRWLVVVVLFLLYDVENL